MGLGSNLDLCKKNKNQIAKLYLPIDIILRSKASRLESHFKGKMLQFKLEVDFR